jgi:hypothetical protein
VNILEFKRQLLFTQRQYQLQRHFQLSHAIIPSQLFQDHRFKFSALHLKKQSLFATHLVLFLLARDKAFHISGKVQRSIRVIYSDSLLQTITEQAAIAWDKLDVISNFPELAINQEFIHASKIALLKIIYADCYSGKVLTYLLKRYHLQNYHYEPIIDQFWLKFTVDEINLACQQILSYLFCSFKVT